MKRLAVIVLACLGYLALAAPALAHPLGNFTTNVHLGIETAESKLHVLLVVDMAEIPSFRERPAIDVDRDDNLSAGELSAYALARCTEHRDQIDLRLPGGAVDLNPGAATAIETAGQGGLTTLRLECSYEGSLASGTTLTVHNRVYEDRLGWAEIVASGDFSGPDIPPTSPSNELRAYPASTRSDVREALLSTGSTSRASAGAIAAGGAATGGLTARLERALAQTGTRSGVLVALAVSLALGAGHALAPGHGKTLMAAYLVGRRGTARQAVGLGLSVAVSHTLGVGILGLVTTLASSAFEPARVYPWLSTASALVVTGIGVVMLVRAARSRSAHRHPHGIHTHVHDDHGHDLHGHDHHDRDDHGASHPRSLGWKSLAAIGLAGGLVPSASALVLLLGAVSIGRPVFGLAMVAAFGVGMSAALVGAGLVALRLTEVGIRRLGARGALGRRWVPVAAGLAVTSVGLVLLGSAVAGAF